MSTETDGPFSQPARVALIDAYFGDRQVVPADAWKDVYRLLMWTDTTTGLAHCYESDKAQPGRPWYARTLAFHAWLADQLEVGVGQVADELDWMFRQVIAQLALGEQDKRFALWDKSALQRADYPDEMPEPGDDPELRQLIEPLLAADHSIRPDDETIRDVLRQVRAHIGSENKRKNLLGRGFEDVLAGVLTRMPGGGPAQVGVQTPIHEVPGFRGVREGEKDEKVDLHVVTETGERIMASAKWSVRADREKQMASDFTTYVDCNQRREPFQYVWITNEYDAARLVANATRTQGNSQVFTDVVHVCPEALRVVHELDADKPLRSTARELRGLIDRDRIRSLSGWLSEVSG